MVYHCILILIAIVYVMCSFFSKLYRVEHKYENCVSGLSNNVQSATELTYKPSIKMNNHCNYSHDKDVNDIEVGVMSIITSSLIGTIAYLNLGAIFAFFIFMVSLCACYGLANMTVNMMISNDKNDVKLEKLENKNVKRVHWGENVVY